MSRRRGWLALQVVFLPPVVWLACSTFEPAGAEQADAGGDGDGEPLADAGGATDVIEAAAVDADAADACCEGPELLAEDQLDPRHVIVHGQRVVWTVFGKEAGAGRVMTAALDGKDAGRLVPDRVDHPTVLAAVGEHLYWGAQSWDEELDSPGTVRRWSRSNESTVVLGTTYSPRAIAATAEGVVWSTWNGDVWAFDAVDGGPSFRITFGLVGPRDVDVDAVGLVLTTAGNGTTQPGTIVRGRFDGSSEDPIKRPGRPWGVRAAADTVFWAEDDPAGGPEGAIMAASRTGPPDERALCLDLRRPRFVAVDAQHVYFTVAGLGANDGHVGRVRRTGAGVCEKLAEGQAIPNGIAVDGPYVYWTTRGDGRVWRIRKPP